MNDIQGVLFDADGTLIDTYDIILTSMRYAVNDVLGCSLDDAELMAGVGTPLYDQMLHFTGGDAARATEITQIYRDHNDGVHDARIRAFGDTKAALERFQAAGIPMGVVTSKRHAMAQRGLEMSGIADHFQFLIGHDDWPEHKPAPGPILRAFGRGAGMQSLRGRQPLRHPGGQRCWLRYRRRPLGHVPARGPGGRASHVHVRFANRARGSAGHLGQLTAAQPYRTLGKLRERSLVL